MSRGKVGQSVVVVDRTGDGLKRLLGVEFGESGPSIKLGEMGLGRPYSTSIFQLLIAFSWK